MNNKGVSVISLVVTIIILILITSTTLYTGMNLVKQSRTRNTNDRLMTVATAVVAHEKELGFNDTVLGGAVADAIAINDNNTPNDYTDDKIVKADNTEVDISDEAFVQVDTNNYMTMGLESFADQSQMPPVFLLKAPNKSNMSEKIYLLKTPMFVRKDGIYQDSDFAYYIYRIYDLEVKDNFKMEFDTQKGVNRPLLTADMIPVKNYFAGSDFDRFSPVYVDDVYKDDWYNYSIEAPMWANVMMRNTTDSSIYANRFYVWIPRFAYRIQDFYRGVDFVDIPASAIDIVFLREDTDYMANDEVLPAGYQVHPAFKYMDNGYEKNIPGFWVSKDYVQTVDSLAEALDAIELSNLHPSIDSTGITSRLLKNTEWAAVAYLSLHTAGKTTNGNSLGNNPSGVVGMNIDVGTLVAGGLADSSMPYMDRYEINDNNISYWSYESKFEEGSTTYTYNFTQRKYGDAMLATSSGSGDHSSWFGGYSEKITAEKPYILRGDEYGNMFSYRAVSATGYHPTIRNVLIIESK